MKRLRSYTESLDDNDEPYQCQCHRQLGDDFYLIPVDQCLYGKCTEAIGRDKPYEEPLNLWPYFLLLAAVLFFLAGMAIHLNYNPFSG